MRSLIDEVVRPIEKRWDRNDRKQLIDGIVHTAAGQLDTWSRQHAGAPWFVHDTIRESAGRWYIVDEELVPESDVPPVSVLA